MGSLIPIPIASLSLSLCTHSSLFDVSYRRWYSYLKDPTALTQMAPFLTDRTLALHVNCLSSVYSCWIVVFACHPLLDVDRTRYVTIALFRWRIVLSPLIKRFGELWSAVSEGDCDSMSANCWIHASDDVRVIWEKQCCYFNALLQCGFMGMSRNCCLL